VVAEVADWCAPDRPVHLVGHSMGGLITRELVLSRAHRLASWVPMCSGPASVPASGHTKLLQLEAALATFPMEVIWTQKEQLDRAGGWNPPSQEVADFCARRFIANDPIALADCAELLMTATDRTAEVADVLAASGLRAAVLTGETDDEWPTESQRQMAERLAAPWHVVPGVGHNPATEDPAATAAALHGIFIAAPASSAPAAR
jgi:pimeloyl-ACP methyl ester carboxylesterase